MDSEIESWLKLVFKRKFEEFSLQIVRNSERGEGYLSDIVFITLLPKNDNINEELNLVLKCCKRSEILRKTTPMKQAFLNEIYVYNAIFPTFTQFQKEKKICDPFDSFPKCYGHVVSEDMEVIVLENLKTAGYSLWNKKLPFTRRHIDTVIKEYAKFHAISFAMKHQQPEKFKELQSKVTDVFKEFIAATDVNIFFGSGIDEICNVMKDECDESTLNKWKRLRANIEFILGEMIEKREPKVISHGDCWNNNFMFKEDPENLAISLKVSVLDWQMARYSTPVRDISYFIFAAISKDDIEDLDEILHYYYNELGSFVAKLESDLNCLYPLEQFHKDWKDCCRCGVLISSMVFKMSLTEQEDVIDITQAAENDNDFGTAFTYDVKDTEALKNRVRHIVKYVAEKELI